MGEDSRQLGASRDPRRSAKSPNLFVPGWSVDPRGSESGLRGSCKSLRSIVSYIFPTSLGERPSDKGAVFAKCSGL